MSRPEADPPSGPLQAEPEEETLAELSVPARAASLKLVRALMRSAGAELGLGEGAAQDLVLAVDEACQNVVRHAFRDSAPGTLTLRVARAGDRAVVRLIDDAPTVDPGTIGPRPIDELRPGGLGTRLMGELLDEVVYEPPASGGGNVLRLSKTIS